MENTAPRWLLWVGLLFLVWNLIGVGAFIMQWNMTPADIAKLPEVQQKMWNAMGGFRWAAYAIAVLCGTAGAIALLMKKKWAAMAFMISIGPLMVQFSNPVGFALGTDELQLIVFPLFIIAVAVLEFFLARKWRNKGWLI
jgi:uncharacterized protein YneF (UPF0154 family)